jgi:hypothetical protein
MKHGKYDFQENIPVTIEDYKDADKLLSVKIRQLNPLFIKVSPEAMRTLHHYPSTTLRANHFYYHGFPLDLDSNVKDMTLVFAPDQEKKEYMEVLQKIATRYDGNRGGHISEQDMRNLAAKVLTKFGNPPFIGE